MYKFLTGFYIKFESESTTRDVSHGLYFLLLPEAVIYKRKLLFFQACHIYRLYGIITHGVIFPSEEI